jgi:hypothetical protein
VHVLKDSYIISIHLLPEVEVSERLKARMLYGSRVDDYPTKQFTASSTRFNVRAVIAIKDATHGSKE